MCEITVGHWTIFGQVSAHNCICLAILSFQSVAVGEARCDGINNAPWQLEALQHVK